MFINLKLYIAAIVLSVFVLSICQATDPPLKSRTSITSIFGDETSINRSEGTFSQIRKIDDGFITKVRFKEEKIITKVAIKFGDGEIKWWLVGTFNQTRKFRFSYITSCHYKDVKKVTSMISKFGEGTTKNRNDRSISQIRKHHSNKSYNISIFNLGSTFSSRYFTSPSSFLNTQSFSYSMRRSNSIAIGSKSTNQTTFTYS